MLSIRILQGCECQSILVRFRNLRFELYLDSIALYTQKKKLKLKADDISIRFRLMTINKT